jgi:diguanylate cyclase (GGDEF)-like protein
MFSILRKLFNDNDDSSYLEKYLIILKMCCFIHATLVPIFFYLQVWVLAFFNVGSVILYLLLLKLIREDSYLKTFLTAYTEIVIHALLCVFVIGNNFRFQFYIPAIVPIMFFIAFSVDSFGSLKYPVFCALVSTVLFCIANIANYFFDPLYPNISKTFQFWIVLYNSIIIMTMLIVSSILFMLQIRGYLRKVEAQNQELVTLASIDPLTGLLNRRKFTADMQELIAENGTFSILISDIDDFKKVNDTYGHDCGDQILTHVTDQFKLLIGSPNLVCRWGGEEIIVLYGGTLDEGAAVAELLRTRIANSPITYNEKTVRVTITTGVSYFDGSDSIDHVIIKADDALYLGKQNGKNQVQKSS